MISLILAKAKLCLLFENGLKSAPIDLSKSFIINQLSFMVLLRCNSYQICEDACGRYFCAGSRAFYNQRCISVSGSRERNDIIASRQSEKRMICIYNLYFDIDFPIF